MYSVLCGFLMFFSGNQYKTIENQIIIFDLMRDARLKYGIIYFLKFPGSAQLRRVL